MNSFLTHGCADHQFRHDKIKVYVHRNYSYRRIIIHLSTRELLQIQDKDVSKYLQGLITNHKTRIESGGGGFLAAFLTICTYHKGIT
ncbi:hypothetical protein KI688_011101 [Linnemannia hyalina]|uniref:Uncharacterized protein n=1 Tax=Linnemannia hyalina TaxID=64524 RepID=A0A9P8BUK3_9FUNG|nr:hypothetical protein KI688_011101 [Linnemannia hyalina]